jgi:hypothetical protein
LNYFLHNVNKPEGRRPLPGRRVPSSLEFYDTSSLFARRLEVLADPDKNLGKAKFLPGYRAVDKSVSIYSFHFEIETVASQEHISSSEGDALVAVDEAMVVAQRLQEGCRLL